MKCLLRKFISSNSEDLKEYYIDFHKVDRYYKFLIKLFKRQNNVFRPMKCLNCDKFLLNHRFKVNHDFLAHYSAGRDAFEEKPVNYINLGEIQKYEIAFAQHSQDYDFYNSEKLVGDIYLSLKSRIRRSAEGNFIIKCGFSQENIQSSPFKNKAQL